MQAEPQAFDRVLSSMCTKPHPDAREAAERFLATNPGAPSTYTRVATLEDEAVAALGKVAGLDDPAGYIASGGTEANIQAVRIARDRADSRQPNVVMPESGHFSFQKAADVLGVDFESSRRTTITGLLSKPFAPRSTTTRQPSSTSRAPRSTAASIRSTNSAKLPHQSTRCSTSTPPGVGSCFPSPTTSGTSATRRSTR
jgi:hypothetical protein